MRLGGPGCKREMAAGTAAHVRPASLKLVSSRCPAGAAVLCWKDLSPSPLTGRSAKTASWPPGTARCSVTQMALIKLPGLTEKERHDTRSHKHGETLNRFFP